MGGPPLMRRGQTWVEFYRTCTQWEATMPDEVVELEPVSILQDAMSAVNGARQMDYGTPLDNHTRTAELWSTYLGIPITAEQVCFLNILQKVSRSMHGLTRDTLVDVAGYAANVDMIQAERERRDA